MNLLIVDDQKNVIEGMQEGIHWDGLSVESVYTANSAKEAKNIISEKKIDAMLCDIEMPGENGLSLFRWAKKQNEQLECLFLTSHAEFEFAKEAMNLGGFGYILQPAPYSVIERAIREIGRHLDSEKKLRFYAQYGREFLETKGALEHRTEGKAPSDREEEQLQTESVRDDCNYVDNVIHYIHRNIGADIRRADLAKEVNLNEDYLSRIFKKQMGVSLKEYILQEKMYVAKNLLKNTNFSVGTISAKVGFDNFAHFSKIYKKMMGKTPAEERKIQ
ncbi:MAG: helix-turn-helix domain-containing protein [Dorea sp.]